MERLIKLLKENNLTFGTVESMTGGLFAATLTSYPGVSSFYKGSLITYAAEEKIHFANVKKETIDKYSVVSPEVALEMAQGGKTSLNVDVCLSITGNAGPSVDKGNKEVGEIYIGLAFDNKSIFKKINLKGDRNDIRSMSIKEMIEFVLQNVKNKHK